MIRSRSFFALSAGSGLSAGGEAHFHSEPCIYMSYVQRGGCGLKDQSFKLGKEWF